MRKSVSSHFSIYFGFFFFIPVIDECRFEFLNTELLFVYHTHLMCIAFQWKKPCEFKTRPRSLSINRFLCRFRKLAMERKIIRKIARKKNPFKIESIPPKKHDFLQMLSIKTYRLDYQVKEPKNYNQDLHTKTALKTHFMFAHDNILCLFIAHSL